MTAVPARNHEQPLGFLPTREFWRNPQNKRLAGIPAAVIVPFAVVVVVVLRPVWWMVPLVFVPGLLLMLGLLERQVRRQ